MEAAETAAKMFLPQGRILDLFMTLLVTGTKKVPVEDMGYWDEQTNQRIQPDKLFVRKIMEEIVVASTDGYIPVDEWAMIDLVEGLEKLQLPPERVAEFLSNTIPKAKKLPVHIIPSLVKLVSHQDAAHAEKILKLTAKQLIASASQGEERLGWKMSPEQALALVISGVIHEVEQNPGQSEQLLLAVFYEEAFPLIKKMKLGTQWTLFHAMELLI